MKKITLLFCLSIVGFVGYAQQEKSSKLIVENETQHNMESADFTTQEFTLLLISDFSSDLAFDNNTHELLHQTTDSASIENKFIEGAYSYNDYALNFTFKPVIIKEIKNRF